MKEIWKVRVLRAKHGTNVKDSVGQTRFSGVYKRNLVNPAFFYFENVDLVDWYPFWKLKFKNWKIENWKIEKLKNWKISGVSVTNLEKIREKYTRARARASLSWAELRWATLRLVDSETKRRRVLGQRVFFTRPGEGFCWSNMCERTTVSERKNFDIFLWNAVI